MRKSFFNSILLFFLFLFLSSLPQALLAEEIKSLEIGSQAPEFSLPAVDGKTYSLKSFSGSKILMIIFTCNHCPTAQAYEERIIALSKKYADKGVAVVAVSPNDPLAIRLDELGYTEYSDSMEDMKARAKEKGFNFPYLYDGETQKMSKAYGPVATPHVFIFDKARKLQYIGRIDDSENPATVKANDAQNALEDLLVDRPVKVAQTKTLGCSTKWSDKRPSVHKFNEECAKEPVALEVINEEALREIIKNSSDKVRLVNVWATWCGPCVAEFPEFITIQRMYKNREFEFISVSADKIGAKEKVLAFLKKKEASGKNYVFNTDDKYKLIEASDKDWQGALPYTLLIAPGGKILYKVQGEIDSLKLKKAIVLQLGRYF